MGEQRNLQNIASAIADGAAIDWTSVESAARNPAERDLLRRLHYIANQAACPPQDVAWSGAAAPPARVAFAAIVGLAALKTALASTAGALLLSRAAAVPAYVWPPLLNLVVFGAAGLALMFGGASDQRSRWLGAFFVLTASAFADRLIVPFGEQAPLAVPIAAATRLAPDAFLAVALWLFVSEFPSPPRRLRDQRLMRAIVRFAAAIGIALFAASALPLLDGHVALSPAIVEAAALLDRRSPSTSYFWPILFVTLALALPYLVWKSRYEATEDRRRVTAFVAAFAGGLTPMIIAVIVSPFLPFFADPARRQLIGVFLYASLLSVVPMTAYAVCVKRVMNLDLIITAAMRHAALRYVIWLVGLAPIGAMVVYTYANRDLTVTQILSTGAPMILIPLVGLIALTFRYQIVRAIDRRLTGDPYNSLQVLSGLRFALRDAQGVRQVIAILTRELERVLHVARVEVLLLDENGAGLVGTTKAVRPLALDSALGELVRHTREEIYVGVESSAPVRRLLPEADQQWLTDHRFQMLVPLTTSRASLIGLIALGEKRIGSGFSAEDRLLLTMMAAHGTMVLENRSLRGLPYPPASEAPGGDWSRIDWDDEPGALCPRCRQMFPSRQLECLCGHATVPAAMPLLLRGTFRVERLLGAGGMGVVYLAVDITLNRRVAIKTIPSLTITAVQRLEREAQAMASVLHPNLAMVFSVERWRGAPIVIMEYLDGGTLADCLATRRLEISGAINLGIVLADVLEQMHATDVLHRDVKPSNIGYTRDGVPKLMDFGIAHVIRRPPPVPDALRPLAPRSSLSGLAPAIRTSPDHVIGTPLYLSPEALDGADPDCSFDLWSLSLTLFESIAGQHPFRSDTFDGVLTNVTHATIPALRDLVPHCPVDLAHFFSDALARDPRRRPATAGEFRARLRRIRADLQLD